MVCSLRWLLDGGARRDWTRAATTTLNASTTQPLSQREKGILAPWGGEDVKLSRASRRVREPRRLESGRCHSGRRSAADRRIGRCPDSMVARCADPPSRLPPRRTSGSAAPGGPTVAVGAGMTQTMMGAREGQLIEAPGCPQGVGTTSEGTQTGLICNCRDVNSYRAHYRTEGFLI